MMASPPSRPSAPPNWEPRNTHSTSPPPIPNLNPDRDHEHRHEHNHEDHHHTHAQPNGHLHFHSPSAPDPRSPARLTLRAHLLGLALGISGTLTLLLLLSSQKYTALWRLPCFLALLSVFHWLEYYTTALYNPPFASVSAFLLRNGWAYNLAHLGAFVECALHYTFYPQLRILLPEQWDKWHLALGVVLVIVGQAVRTTAMAHAGTNFNHLVQSRKRDGHVLVTDGVYAWLRHPSYFGFFWWAVGTQVILGNIGGVVVFAAVLWNFFRGRVEKEESFLISFFGDEYIRYRAQTPVGIPFIS